MSWGAGLEKGKGAGQLITKKEEVDLESDCGDSSTQRRSCWLCIYGANRLELMVIFCSVYIVSSSFSLVHRKRDLIRVRRRNIGQVEAVMKHRVKEDPPLVCEWVRGGARGGGGGGVCVGGVGGVAKIKKSGRVKLKK